MPAAEKNKIVSSEVTKKMYDRVRNRAATECRSVSDLIRRALEIYLDQVVVRVKTREPVPVLREVSQ